MDRAEFVVVANRLPVDRLQGPQGESIWGQSPGGLVTALEPVPDPSLRPGIPVPPGLRPYRRPGLVG